jgi:hypothetical protein
MADELIEEATSGVRFPLNEALRRRALAVLTAAGFDTVVTYEALTEAMGLDPSQDRRARTAVLRAATTVLKEQHKKLVNLKSVGYRIVRPDEHVTVSQQEQRNARRRLRRSLDTVLYVALAELPPLEVSKVVTEQARLGLLIGLTRRLTRLKVLPPSAQMQLPSGESLLAVFRKKTG